MPFLLAFQVAPLRVPLRAPSHRAHICGRTKPWRATAAPPIKLAPDTIATVKATVPVLREHGTRIADRFYHALFERHPEVRRQFNVDRQRGGATADDGVPAQLVALTNSLIAYARTTDNLSVVRSRIEGICQKHVSRGVSAEQYAAVGECYLYAMRAELGDAATPQIIAAWAEAFDVLAEIYVQRERELRAILEQRAGYAGFIDMAVVAIEAGEKDGRLLALRPVHASVPLHQKGQFVSIEVEKDGAEATMTSMKVVDSGQESLWITIPESKESASRYLLDEVHVGTILKVSIPCGKFSDE